MQKDLARALKTIEKSESYQLWITRLKWDLEDNKDQSKYERAKKILNSQKETKIAEYYVEYFNYCKYKILNLYKRKNQLFPADTPLTYILRWKTLLGLELQGKVRTFIEDKNNSQKNTCSPPWLKVNFYGLPITINNITKDINDWLKEIVDDGTTQTGWADLCGIDLSKINLIFLSFENANLEYANFSNSGLINLDFNYCKLDKCNFTNSNLINITLNPEHLSFSNSDFSGARIQNSNILGRNSIISQISWKDLVLIAITTEEDYKPHYTSFSRIVNIKYKKGYISWFQDTIIKYTENINLTKRIFNILTALLTKNWNSLWVTAGAGMSFVLMFSIIYWCFLYGFKFDLTSITNAIYHSFSVFVAFEPIDLKEIPGFKTDNDIPDKFTNCIHLLMMIELVVGYVWLAIIVFLLSNKISENRS